MLIAEWYGRKRQGQATEMEAARAEARRAFTKNPTAKKHKSRTLPERGRGFLVCQGLLQAGYCAVAGEPVDCAGVKTILRFVPPREMDWSEPFSVSMAVYL
jgi:hypothetical protein